MERYVHFYQTLINSYFQIPVKERNITKIELTKILFYLRIMAESFERLTDKVLRNLLSTYINDMLITLRSMIEHIVHLQFAFKCLQHFCLKFNINK